MWRSEHLNFCFIRKWRIPTDTLVPRYQNTQENYTLDFCSDSNSEKEVYFGGRETARPRICPLMRYFKPMKAVQRRNGTVFRFIVIY